MTLTANLRPKRFKRFVLRPATAILAVLAISGCTLGDIGERMSPRPSASQTLSHPKPDARGVINYPNYQVIVARRGDSLEDIGARVGLSGAALAKHNGLPENYRTRNGEVLSLPKGVVLPAADSSGRSIEDIATTAIDNAQPSTRVQTPVQTGSEPIRHTVESGETAYSIARLYGVSVTALASWNGLDRNLSVRVGQQLLIPVTEEGTPQKTAAVEVSDSNRTSAPGEGSTAPEPPSSSKPLPANEQVAPLPESPNLATNRTPAGASRKLLTPVKGKVIRGYSRSNEGLDIGAAKGSAVKAAEDGEIALVSKSVGQSTIVLLRHPDNLYTVYSNIDGVTLKKGQTVRRGQTLGSVAGGNPAYLHFEIRRGTESVDPVPYL